METTIFSRNDVESPFQEIMKFLRFDIRAFRRERLQHDKFALVSGENITVDEQLFPTKVRCRFTQYMSNKPDKFGIKFWIPVDTKSKYVLNAFSYLGKDETRPQDQALSENVVLRLLEPFTKKGKNVTTDNFFASVKLAEKLAKLNTTIVGTMNRSRREVQELVKSSRGYLYETMKKKKKPETVLYYNDTKYGDDFADQMARKYTVKASSRRWPVHIFYNILDLAAISAYILYKEITGKKIKRRDFLLELAEELAEEYKRKEAVKKELLKKKKR
ncbi:hypothetical protein ILUMI_21693 [Ignelater luminosus]|uniref:PiggyBac transposable element-derived protein domain-containing protein n=1 Tax=Ignelater luminosus TaxID=2038154 RepID=A0A8K0G3B4_IGNLU|nr:hypothetical protein ILUMI_21693 [Ignelater luminosus]